MNSNFIRENKSTFLILIPAFITFFLVLIPTLKYQWPLSWDIFYHIHLAELYQENGVIFFDKLTYAPYGRPISYPPLFHFLLVGISKIFTLNLFDAARALQPILASLVILSYSYVGYKLYNIKTGFLTGILVMFSLFFHRMMLPIPETMALVLLPLIAYFYYISLEKGDFKHALLAGIFLGLVLLLHLLSAGIILLVIILFTIILKLNKKNVNYRAFWVFVVTAIVLAAIWWIPLLLNYGFVFHSPPGQAILWNKILILFGVVPILFAFIGGMFSLKKRETRDMLILTWLISLIVLAACYYMGIPLLIDRILNFALFPLMVLAAIGVQCVRINGDKKTVYALMGIILIFAAYWGFNTANSLELQFSPSEIQVAEWFKNHGDKQRVVIAGNYHIDPIIVSISRQPVSAGGYAPGMVKALGITKYLEHKYDKEDIIKDEAGYLVLKKTAKKPPYSSLVYENQQFKIFELQKFE